VITLMSLACDGLPVVRMEMRTVEVSGAAPIENAIWSNLMDNVATFCGSSQ